MSGRKVYFAGSIRGGRADADLYRRIIDYIRRTDTVLTEHIGDLALSSLEGSSGTDEMIYAQDTRWIRECDLVIAECTNPSLGVGYELAFAESLGKPCCLFYDSKRTVLSAMLSGNPSMRLFPYEEEKEIYSALDRILSE